MLNPDYEMLDSVEHQNCPPLYYSDLAPVVFEADEVNSEEVNLKTYEAGGSDKWVPSV